MWTEHPEDRQLARILPSLKLEEGLEERIMAGLKTGTAPVSRKASLAARGLLTLSLVESLAVAALMITGALSLSQASLLTSIPHLTGCGAAMIVGTLLALSAERLSHFDCRCISRLTGQVSLPTTGDILIIRGGATLILSIALIAQL